LLAVNNSGVTSSATVASGGVETISSGGSAISTTILSGGSDIVSSGGSAVGTLLSGGTETVFGSASGTVLDASAVQIVASGGVAISTVIDATDSQIVQNGGIASSTHVLASGSMIIESGGSGFFTRIDAGGQETVQAGGLEEFGTAFGTIDLFGTAFFETVSGGTLTVESGGSANTTLLSAGSVETVSAGGLDFDTVIYGSAVQHVLGSGSVHGVTNLDEVSSGGTQLVENGGLAGSTRIDSGGVQVVESGGEASSSFIFSSGVESALAGGFDTGTIISNGGVQQLFTTGVGEHIGSAGLQLVESGGSATNVLIAPGGSQFVLSGGAATSTTVESGGTEIVSAGGSDFTASLFGFQDVFGLASGAIVFSGGLQTVENGGTAIGTVLDDHDSQVVNSGGTVSGTVIGATDSEIVESGGTTVSTIISGGTLDVHAGAIVSGGITFQGTGGTYEIEGTAIPGATVSGFVSGDFIDLASIPFDSGGHADLTSGNVLDITENGSSFQIQLDPDQNFAGDFFHLSHDLSEGTLVTEDTTPCYCRGTLILTPKGEVPVEALQIGDRVVTLSGKARPIVWIRRRSYSGQFVIGREDVLPVCITAGAIADNVPRRDLWISPNHALYLEGVLIEAKDLVNGVSVYQAEAVETVEYFHLELDSHDVILAEGAAAETYIDDDNRGLFHNAQEYWAAHPDEVRGPARYCAPRHEEGFEVERARRLLAERAGIAAPAERTGESRLRGHVDTIGRRQIVGWAYDEAAPEAPVCLDIYAGDRLIGQAVANRYREDLERAGIGTGRHGFQFTPPKGLAFAPGAVSVRRARDGAALSLSWPLEQKLTRRMRRAGHKASSA
jgi:autotransporter passenger strand-loop-strand repeat protein